MLVDYVFLISFRADALKHENTVTYENMFEARCEVLGRENGSAQAVFHGTHQRSG